MGWLPPALKDWIRLLQVQRRYPQAAHIWSPRIGPSARLGHQVGIAEHVVVNDGVELGDWSYASKGAILFSGSIGRFCSIGHYALIGPEDHALDHVSTSPNLYKASPFSAGSGWDEFASPPRIGSDVWIGAHAVVLQGVTIGHGAVIGAGALVTTDVEPYAIVGGVPSRLLRMRFSDEAIADLLELSWWDWSDEDLRVRLGPAFAAGSTWRDFPLREQ